MEIDDQKKRQITVFVIREAKKYVCYCGRTGMDFSKLDMKEHSVLVDIKCNDNTCDHTRRVEMYYPDDIIWGR